METAGMATRGLGGFGFTRSYSVSAHPRSIRMYSPARPPTCPRMRRATRIDSGGTTESTGTLDSGSSGTVS